MHLQTEGFKAVFGLKRKVTAALVATALTMSPSLAAAAAEADRPMVPQGVSGATVFPDTGADTRAERNTLLSNALEFPVAGATVTIPDDQPIEVSGPSVNADGKTATVSVSGLPAEIKYARITWTINGADSVLGSADVKPVDGVATFPNLLALAGQEVSWNIIFSVANNTNYYNSDRVDSIRQPLKNNNTWTVPATQDSVEVTGPTVNPDGKTATVSVSGLPAEIKYARITWTINGADSVLGSGNVTPVDGVATFPNLLALAGQEVSWNIIFSVANNTNYYNSDRVDSIRQPLKNNNTWTVPATQDSVEVSGPTVNSDGKSATVSVSGLPAEIKYARITWTINGADSVLGSGDVKPVDGVVTFPNLLALAGQEVSWNIIFSVANNTNYYNSDRVDSIRQPATGTNSWTVPATQDSVEVSGPTVNSDGKSATVSVSGLPAEIKYARITWTINGANSVMGSADVKPVDGVVTFPNLLALAGQEVSWNIIFSVANNTNYYNSDRVDSIRQPATGTNSWTVPGDEAVVEVTGPVLNEGGKAATVSVSGLPPQVTAGKLVWTTAGASGASGTYYATPTDGTLSFSKLPAIAGGKVTWSIDFTTYVGTIGWDYSTPWNSGNLVAAIRQPATGTNNWTVPGEEAVVVATGPVLNEGGKAATVSVSGLPPQVTAGKLVWTTAGASGASGTYYATPTDGTLSFSKLPAIAGGKVTWSIDFTTYTGTIGWDYSTPWNSGNLVAAIRQPATGTNSWTVPGDEAVVEVSC